MGMEKQGKRSGREGNREGTEGNRETGWVGYEKRGGSTQR